jgi:hypothetical protein
VSVAGTAPAALDSERPIILQAVPRSGSHLLRHVLNAHPEAFIAAASEVLGVLSNPELSWRDLERRLDAEAGETFRTASDLLLALHRFHLAFWTTSAEPGRLGKTRTRRWGFMDYTRPDPGRMPIARLFPEATFIHIVRDGRNVVASWLANWRVASNRMGLTLRQPTEIARLWAERLAAIDAARTLVVRVEDLHAEAARPGALAAIFGHCGLDPCAETEALLHDLPWVNAEKRVLNRWQEDLSAAALAGLSRVRGFEETLRRFGYL